MKQFYVFFMSLLASLNVSAQDKVMTIDNQTPGWLSSNMTYAQQVAVEDLPITGYINPTDMEFVNGLINRRSLKVLNLDKVHLVDEYNDDVLWRNFISCSKPLQKLVMPRTLVYSPNTSSLNAANIDSLVINSGALRENCLSRVPRHLIFTENVMRIPKLAFNINESSDAGRCVVTLPSTIKEIGACAFCGYVISDADFLLPDSIVRLGSPEDSERAWFVQWNGGGTDNVVPISSTRFEFPESLKAYHGGYGYIGGYYQSYYTKYAQHEYTSDTIIVGSKCDTLGIQLTAKIAYFKVATPPKYLQNSNKKFPYNIDKLYVPKGSLDAYKKVFGSYSTYIKEIEEIKTIENIALRYTSPHKMLKEESCELFDEIQPADAFDKRIKWSSSNEEVATVDANGVVTAHKNGTATITVSSYDGSVTNSCEIIVAQPVTGVSIEPAEIGFHNLGDKAQLKAVFEPEDATNKNVTWKSSNESVCSISADGSIIATGYGKTVVLATTEDGNFVGTCIVVVTEASAIKQTSLSESGFKVIDRTIVFDDSNDVESQITTLGGALVYKGNAKRICLRSGMYLVKAGSKVRKVCIP